MKKTALNAKYWLIEPTAKCIFIIKLLTIVYRIYDKITPKYSKPQCEIYKWNAALLIVFRMESGFNSLLNAQKKLKN